jgi:hypothetical protein
LLILFAALAKGAVEVVTVAAKDAAVIGRRGPARARRTGSPSKGGRYEVPKADVRERLTVRAC